jgi:hypothetical protein
MAYLDGVLMLLLAAICCVPIIITVGWLVHKNSFKNRTIILRQTGINPGDVIIVDDMIKLRNLDGVWEIQFYNMREKSPSVPGKYFMRFLAKKYSQKILRMGDDAWKQQDMSSKIKRGIIFYETTEGEFFPMGITVDNVQRTINLTTVNQDNRSFVLSNLKKHNDLTKNKNAEKLLLWGIIVGIIGIVVVSGILIYFQNKTHEDNIQATAAICGQYTVSIINALTNTNSSTKPAYLNNIKPVFSLPNG